jgi:putative ABC transport system permease protein
MISSLNRKLLRDVWRMRGQVLAIASVVGAAVATFVLALTAFRSLSDARDAYYERYRYSNVFVQLKRAPEPVAERIRALPGVARADTRVTQFVTIDMPDTVEPVRGLLTSLPAVGEPVLNALFLRSGRLPTPERVDEIVLHEAFALAHALEPGASITAILNGKRRKLTVVGVALSPEFIYVIGPGELVPDNRRFGVGWMAREALAAAFDFKRAFNDVTIQTLRGASEPDVIAQVDRALAPFGARGAYGREDHISHAFINSELNQLSTMASVIPPIFFLVSAFLLHIVISRLIQTEREQIGLLKAFGYSDREIGWHYIKFALVVLAIGVAIGWGLGAWFGRAITGMYSEYFRFPVLTYSASPDVFLLAAVMGSATAISGTLAATGAAMRLAPAVAMSPPAPTVYRETLLERFGLGAGLSAVGFMIMRHIARWPTRSLATVMGVALAIGLLISMLQFFDSIETMIESFFFRTQKQDATIQFAELRGDEVRYELARLPGVLRAELRRVAIVRLRNGHLSQRTAIIGTDGDGTLTQQISEGGRTVALPPRGLVLSDYLARQLSVKEGDRVDIEFLEGRRLKTTSPVVRIASEFISSAAYMDRVALNRLMQTPGVADSALLKTDATGEPSLFRAVKDAPAVLGTIANKQTVLMFRKLLDEHLVTTLTIYVLFASIIAVGVTYNSGRISFSERANELATLRVLGRHKSEVAAILIGEIALLTVAAIPLGCLIGYGLSWTIITMFTTDLYRMPFGLLPKTYATATIYIAIATALSCITVAWRVHRLDLVRVLKARD